MSPVFDDLGDHLIDAGLAAEIVGIGLKNVELAGFNLRELIGSGANHSLKLAEVAAGGLLILPDVLRKDVGAGQTFV